MNKELKQYLYTLVGKELTYEDKEKILMYFEKLHQKNIKIKHKNLQDRIDRAIEYIEDNLYPVGNDVNGSDLPYDEAIQPLVDILKGSDKE